MGRRTDISHVLVIGSGPIVIGQACEFDYSGTQACRVLREEGLRVSLVNSNPATIMTDPEFADATYIEPITPEFVEKVIAAEQAAGFPVTAVLATLGGQTALNTAVALHERGVLARYGVELIGADIEAIQRGEDRLKFKDVVHAVGAEVPRSAVCGSLDQVRDAVGGSRRQEGDLDPAVLRPPFGAHVGGDRVERSRGRGNERGRRYAERDQVLDDRHGARSGELPRGALDAARRLGAGIAGRVDVGRHEESPAAGGGRRGLDRARELLTAIEEQFATPEGGLSDRTGGEPDLGNLVRREQPLPENCSIAESALRLATLLEGPRSSAFAGRTVAVFAPADGRAGRFSAPYGRALRRYFTPAVSVVLAGSVEATAEMREAAHRLPAPFIAVRTKPGDGPAAYLCRGTACAAPVYAAADLRKAYDSIG